MAQGRSVGSLFIDIEARTARMEADLAKTRGILKRMQADVSLMSRGFAQAFGAMKGAVAAFVGVASFRALNNMTLAQYENVRAMMALADQTNLTIGQIQAYQKASEFLNVTNLDLKRTMKELLVTQSEASLGNRKAIDDFKKLGLTLEFVQTALPGDLFEATLESLSRYGNASDRAAMATRIFGKQALELGPLLTQGKRAIDEARDSLRETNSEISRMDAAKVQVALGAINELQDRWQGFKQRLAVGLAPVMYAFSNFLSRVIEGINIEDLANKISMLLVKIYAFVVTLPERVSYAVNKLKLELMEMVQFMSGTMGGKFGAMFRLPDLAPQIEQTKQKLEDLRATFGTISGQIESDFMQQVELVLRNLGVVEIATKTAVSEATMIMVQTFSSAFSQLSDVLAEFVTEGEANFADFGRMVVKQMISMLIKLSILNPLMNMVFGGMSGWTALPTVPGMARGGPVVSGDMAIVGENGPELVEFNRSGRVVPTPQTMNRLENGSATGLTINVPFTIMPGVSHAEFSAKIPEIINLCKGAVAEAVLRGGAYGKAMRA